MKRASPHGAHGASKTSTVLEGALIGAGVGILLACLTITLLLWRERRRSERRRFETIFGPTPFLVRSPLSLPVAHHTVRRPRTSPRRVAEASTIGLVGFSGTRRKSVDYPLRQVPRGIPPAFITPPKGTETDLKGIWEENIRRTQAFPQAHIRIPVA